MTQGGWKASAVCFALAGVAFLLCIPISLKAPNKGIWNIRPAYYPTPPADKDLSSSKDAIRDPAYLPGEIAAIVGAYVGSLVIVCIALLTIGRRLRRAVQASPRTLAMEIVRPIPMNKPSTDNPWGPSPISPGSKNGSKWPSPNPAGAIAAGWGSITGSKHRYQESIQSVVTFDESVISDDKARNEMELDRLYAAVAVHEAQRERAAYASSQASDVPLRSPLAQHPPELQHLRSPPGVPLPTSPTSTRYPIPSAPPSAAESPYPPLPPMPRPEDIPPPPPSRGSTKSPRRLNKPSPIQVSQPPSRTSSRSSFASFGRKKSASIRDLPISPPLPTSPGSLPAYGYDASAGAPPTPRGEAFASVQLDSGRRFHFAPSVHSPRTPMSPGLPSPGPTPSTAGFPPTPTARAPPPAIREQPSQEDANRAHAYHGFHFQLDAASQRSTSPPPTSVRSGRSGSRPAPLALNNAGGSGAGSAAQAAAALPLRMLRSPRSQRPPSTIRATELERPQRHRAAMLSPGTAGAVPPTPYSPYMPMTPLTPMTPSRLVTREERKRMKKEGGRRLLTQEDVVPEESELWAEGW